MNCRKRRSAPTPAIPTRTIPEPRSGRLATGCRGRATRHRTRTRCRPQPGLRNTARFSRGRTRSSVIGWIRAGENAALRGYLECDILACGHDFMVTCAISCTATRRTFSAFEFAPALEQKSAFERPENAGGP